MGDIIHAMVALQYIKQSYPDVIIDWIVEEAFVQILEGNPHIDTILPLNLKSIKKKKSNLFAQIKLIREYAKNHYDVVIDAQGLLKSAITAKLIASKQSIIVGFDQDSIRESVASWFYRHKVSIAYHENTIDRNVKVLCEYFNIEPSSQTIINKHPFLFFQENEQLTIDGEYMVFVIGSTWESRNYPKEKFVEIANALQMPVYISWGSEEERQKALWMEEQSRYIKALPKMNLNGLKQTIAHAKLLIGNDTGPTHIAWGMNVPSITIFGPTPTNRVYTTPINKVIKSDSQVNHYKLDKSDFSITKIDPKTIVDTALILLRDV
jgi:heptosyltransferase-1